MVLFFIGNIFNGYTKEKETPILFKGDFEPITEDNVFIDE